MRYLLLSLSLFFLISNVAAADRAPAIATDQTVIIDGLKIDFPSWAHASDEELVNVDGQWWLYFTSINLQDGGTLNTIAAYLPKGQGLDAPPSKWQFYKENGKIVPIIKQSANQWDSHAIETVKFVRGYDATAKRWVNRIYYTGWQKPGEGIKYNYSVGFAEEKNKKWVKHGQPVLVGKEAWETLEMGTILGDQTVIYQPGNGPKGANGIWHMWYQAGGKDAAGGNDTVIMAYANSKDGVKWENKKPIYITSPFGKKNRGPFHSYVFTFNGRFAVIGWVGNPEDVSKQGLYMVSSSTPDGSKPGDFTDWVPVIYEDDGTDWHYSGKKASECHSTGLFSSIIQYDKGSFWVFFTGIHNRNPKADPCKEQGDNIASIGRARIAVEKMQNFGLRK